MKATAKLFALTLALSGAFAPVSLMAIPQVTMGTFHAGSSGNYRADPNADLSYVIGNYASGATDGTWFGTFCIEKNEYFSPGSTYNVALNDRAIGGGAWSPTPGYDIISRGTAYLYTQFATGSLSNYYGNATNSANLQDLIWWLEGEQEFWGAGTYNSLLAAQFGTNWQTAAIQDYTGTAVKVLNLTDNAGRHQDQLVYLGNSVPDSGWTLGLLSMGVLSVAMVGRRAHRS